MSCPHCHQNEGYYHFDYCRVSRPFSAPRNIIVGDEPRDEPPIVFLPLMRIPAKPEKPTKYPPEVWKPNG